MSEQPLLGVIGGSGLYSLFGLEGAQSIEVDTPFGKPSSPVLVGRLKGKLIAFIARHGIGHTISPSNVNYRANIYALKKIGVRYVVGVSACGSLRHDYEPGNFIVPDQVVDFTRERKRSFFDEELVAHVGTADPYCPDFSARLIQAASSTGFEIYKGGTFITIEGPRFSTRAESHLFRAWGISIIGMTASPEVFLAREAELCYATLAHITDYDVWHLSEEPVNVEMVIKTLIQNTEKAQKVIQALIGLLDNPPTCDCSSALSKALITNPSQISAESRQRLALLIDKYISL